MSDRTDPLRVAVVGLGGMGTFHARTIDVLPEATVTLLADPYRPDLDDLARELGAEWSREPHAAIDDDSIDAVVISSPDETHADLAVRALGAGKPLLCEKPLATTLDDARRVAETERATGRRLLQLGFMREYDPAHRQVVAVLTELGRVHHVRCTHLNTAGSSRPLEVIVSQSLVHDIHSVRFITGAEITSVFAHVTRDDRQHIRHLLAMCTLSSGGHATLEFDAGAFAYEVGVEVTAERGGIIAGQPLQAEVRAAGDRRVEVGADWFGRFADAYRLQDRAWVMAARRGGATGPGSVDGLAAQAVATAIVDSVVTGTPVDVAHVEL